MKSKLYLLFALLSLTAVFASPALAAPPVPTITNLNDGQLVRDMEPISITTDVTADSVEIIGRDGVHLGWAGPRMDSNSTIWDGVANFGNEADSLTYPISVVATFDGESSSDSVTVQLDKVASPDAPSWMSPNEDGMELYGEVSLRTITAPGIDSVEFFVDGDSVGQGFDSYENGSTWDISVNLDDYSLGSHTLTAVAHEGDEFSLDSDMTVTVIDVTSPAFSGTSPSEGSTISGSDFQLTVYATDNAGPVVSGDYSLNGEDWLPLTNLGEGSFRTSEIDTTVLENGTTFIYVRVFDEAGNEGSFSPGFVVENHVSPVLNMDEVVIDGTLMVDGFGVFAYGATATGFPEPEITYSWFICDADFHCVDHPGEFFTPTEEQIGYTVWLNVNALSFPGFGGSDSDSILVGTVVAAPVWVDPPADPPAGTPVAPAVVVAPPVKSPEVVKAEEKVVEAAKSVEAAKAEVTEEKKDVVVAQTVVKKAKKKVAAAKAEVKEAKAEVKAEREDVAEATTKLKKAKKAKKNAAKKTLAKQAKELAASEREVKAAIKVEVKATANVKVAEKMVAIELKQVTNAQEEVAASETELNNSQKELDKVK